MAHSELSMTSVASVITLPKRADYRSLLATYTGSSGFSGTMYLIQVDGAAPQSGRPWKLSPANSRMYFMPSSHSWEMGMARDSVPSSRCWMKSRERTGSSQMLQLAESGLVTMPCFSFPWGAEIEKNLEPSWRRRLLAT